MKPANQNDLGLLGLGHLNMIYMALKMVEYEFNRTRELINIMIIEEPEAHIHTHIQRTLFDKLSISTDYTQIIMTTHSTYLSEVSEISKVNILKTKDNLSYAMTPIYGLDEFGEDNLKIKNFKLSKCIERYLDVKRSVLLFSKGVILVEGDGEEILIPNMVKNAFGVSLDELGIGLINVGSTAFEYIACLFADDRINRYCSIITDMDKQVVDSEDTFFKATAETKGIGRKDKLDGLFSSNTWVESFYAESTLEIEFSKHAGNLKYIKEIIGKSYNQKATIIKHKSALKGTDSQKASTILTLADNIGKGWYAILLSNEMDCNIQIPDYILQAIAFSCQEIISIDILIEIIEYSLERYGDDEQAIALSKLISSVESFNDKKLFIIKFVTELSNDIVSKFISQLIKYIDWLGECCE